jgi:hypothetical protein
VSDVGEVFFGGWGAFLSLHYPSCTNLENYDIQVGYECRAHPGRYIIYFRGFLLVWVSVLDMWLPGVTVSGRRG